MQSMTASLRPTGSAWRAAARAPKPYLNRHKTAIGALSCALSLTFFSLATEAYAGSPAEQQPGPEAQRSGRRGIVTHATLYGFSLYGPGTIRLLDIESERRVAGLQMLIGGGSFFWALEATKDYRLGAGRSLLILGGSWAGTLYGLGVPVFFESENDKAYWAAAMIGTPAGGLIAHRLSSHRWFERGETDLMVAGGLTGGLYGVAIPYLLDIEALDEWTQARIYVASAMVGAPAGLWTTKRLMREKSINQGRAHLVSLGGVVGASYASGVLSLADVENPRAHVFAAMLGLPVGTYLGHRWTAEEEYTPGRARWTILGAYIGTLFGTGVALVADAEDHKPYVLANMLGSAAGIWYAHRFTRDNQTPRPDRVSVSLPSLDQWVAMGLTGIPVELVRITF